MEVFFYEDIRREWIRKNFAIFNTKYFNNSIPTPRFSVNNCPPDLWACYDSATDTLSITQKYLRPEKSIKEALLHEMIHYYCFENDIKDVSRGGTYHNKRFRDEAEKRMKEIGEKLIKYMEVVFI